MSILDISQSAELTPVVKLLLYLALAAFAVMLSVAAWLGKRLWNAARQFERSAGTLEDVPKLKLAVFGSGTDETESPKPGLLRRQRATEERLDAVWQLLGLSDPDAKRALVRAKLLGGEHTEDTGQHRALGQQPTTPHPMRRIATPRPMHTETDDDED